MSVVSPPSSNTNVGNAGAGGSTTQLSALAWATSSVSINSIQSSNLYPAITSGTTRAFSWFHSKSFRVMHLHSVNTGQGTVAFSYPGGANSGRSFRYDTYSYVQITATALSGYAFLAWYYGDSTEPTSGVISSNATTTLYSTDWTSTSYFHIWAGFAVSSGDVYIDSCGTNADGSGGVNFYCTSSVAVNTNVTISLTWSGDLFSTVYATVVIFSGDTCGVAYEGGAYAGENYAGLSVNSISPSSSGAQTFVSSAVTGGSCDACAL